MTRKEKEALEMLVSKIRDKKLKFMTSAVDTQQLLADLFKELYCNIPDRFVAGYLGDAYKEESKSVIDIITHMDENDLYDMLSTGDSRGLDEDTKELYLEYLYPNEDLVRMKKLLDNTNNVYACNCNKSSALDNIQQILGLNGMASLDDMKEELTKLYNRG